jgi:hypothetical protein
MGLHVELLLDLLVQLKCELHQRIEDMIDLGLQSGLHIFDQVLLSIHTQDVVKAVFLRDHFDISDP